MKRNKSNILPQTVGETEDCLEQLLDGIRSDMPGNTKWTIAGVPFAKAELEKKVADFLSIYRKPREAEAAFHRATRERDEQETATDEFLADVLVTLTSQLGRKSEDLEKFGFRPRKEAARPRNTKAKNGAVEPRKPEEGARPAA